VTADGLVTVAVTREHRRLPRLPLALPDAELLLDSRCSEPSSCPADPGAHRAGPGARPRTGTPRRRSSRWQGL
jgi:hypothetical protein